MASLILPLDLIRWTYSSPTVRHGVVFGVSSRSGQLEIARRALGIRNKKKGSPQAVDRRSQFIKHQFINIAPAPFFTRLNRLNDRMIRLVEVLCGVFVF